MVLLRNGLWISLWEWLLVVGIVVMVTMEVDP